MGNLCRRPEDVGVLGDQYAQEVTNPVGELASKINKNTSPAATTPSPTPKTTGVYIEGYLMRQSREGKWKKRYYETIEENGWWMLVYYKTPEREKILNAVKLHRTLKITTQEDANVFAIEMESGQIYMHKAASRTEAQKWVGALMKCRSAAIEQKSLARIARRASVTIEASGDDKGGANRQQTLPSSPSSPELSTATDDAVSPEPPTRDGIYKPSPEEIETFFNSKANGNGLMPFTTALQFTALDRMLSEKRVTMEIVEAKWGQDSEKTFGQFTEFWSRMEIASANSMLQQLEDVSLTTPAE